MASWRGAVGEVLRHRDAAVELGPLLVQLAQAGTGEVGVAAAAVDGQGLGPGAGDGALELGQRIAGGVGAADVEAVVPAGDDVEHGGLAVAAGGRVGQLAKHAVVAQDEVAVRGLALGLVDGGGVGVLHRGPGAAPDLGEVLRVERDTSAVDRGQGHGVGLEIDGIDVTLGSVAHAGVGVVDPCHHQIAALERPITHEQRRTAEAAVLGQVLAGPAVEVVDVGPPGRAHQRFGSRRVRYAAHQSATIWPRTWGALGPVTSGPGRDRRRRTDRGRRCAAGRGRPVPSRDAGGGSRGARSVAGGRLRPRRSAAGVDLGELVGSSDQPTTLAPAPSASSRSGASLRVPAMPIFVDDHDRVAGEAVLVLAELEIPEEPVDGRARMPASGLEFVGGLAGAASIR